MAFMRAPDKVPDIPVDFVSKEDSEKPSVLKDIRLLFEGIIRGDIALLKYAQKAVETTEFSSIMVVVPPILTDIIPMMHGALPLHILLMFMYILRFVFISKYLHRTENATVDNTVKSKRQKMAEDGGELFKDKYDHFYLIPEYEYSYFFRHLGIYKDAAMSAVMDLDRNRGRDNYIRCNEVFFHRMMILIGHATLDKRANNPIRPYDDTLDLKNPKKNKQGIIAFTYGYEPVVAPMQPSPTSPENEDDRYQWETQVYKFVNYRKGYNECIKYNKKLANAELKFAFKVRPQEDWMDIAHEEEEEETSALSFTHIKKDPETSILGDDLTYENNDMDID